MPSVNLIKLFYIVPLSALDTKALSKQNWGQLSQHLIFPPNMPNKLECLFLQAIPAKSNVCKWVCCLPKWSTWCHSKLGSWLYPQTLDLSEKACHEQTLVLIEQIHGYEENKVLWTQPRSPPLEWDSTWVISKGATNIREAQKDRQKPTL